MYDDRSGRVVCSPHTEGKAPLPLLCWPLSFSFGVYEGEHLLTDPTSFEEGFTSDSTITLGLAADTPLGRRWASHNSGEGMDMDEQQARVVYLHQAGYCRAAQPVSEPPDTQIPSEERKPAPLLSTEDVLALCLKQARERYDQLLALLPTE